MADEPYLLVRSSASDMPGGSHIADHAHGWHQLIYVAAGLMTVRTGAGSWIAPPSWAVWVPAGMRHAIRFVGRSELRTLYLKADGPHELPADCCSLAVSPLLRELVVRTTAMGMLDERDPVEAAMAMLIASELGHAGPPPFTLREPNSAATVRAAALMAADAPESASIAALAQAVGLGARTLERRFRAETGLTPGRWQQQRRLLKGLELIGGGESVKTAAAAAGFTTPSAYIAAFRKAFDATPAAFFRVERDGSEK